MREMNIELLDLNLLVALKALLDEKHVSRAAERIGLSQPAMSRALARLRKALNDPLLVKSASVYVQPHEQMIYINHWTLFFLKLIRL